ncbi:MAG: radical SAM protein [Bryobacterales bacterium]|nr:radical SAM protein [Bryobacterales bacterium]
MTFEGLPLLLGWELTLACNLRCQHCGSSAGSGRPNELTLDEALAICTQFPELAVQEVVFTGGEPLMQPYWPQLATRLRELQIKVGMVTNGLLLSPRIVAEIQACGIREVGVSLDGLETTHDEIRALPGAFLRSLDGLRRLLDAGIHATAITTVNALNVHELPALYARLHAAGVPQWQVQPLFGFGRGREQTRLHLSSDQYLDMGRFCQEHGPLAADSGMTLVPADGCGYCSPFDTQGAPWRGCSAGIADCGIMSDGRVKGCLSWPDSLVEGDLRQDTFWDIWFRPGAFAATRNFTCADLGGECRTCEMGAQCGGGCSAKSIAATGQFHADPYCYRAILAARLTTQ